MTWFYEIRDSKNNVVDSRQGFKTIKEAMGAGRRKARELKTLGRLRDGGSVGTGLDSGPSR